MHLGFGLTRCILNLAWQGECEGGITYETAWARSELVADRSHVIQAGSKIHEGFILCLFVILALREPRSGAGIVALQLWALQLQEAGYLV